MNIIVERQRIYFSPLCIGLSCFHAFVCFMGFLIKTRKACVVYDMEGCVGEAVCLIVSSVWQEAPLPVHTVDWTQVCPYFLLLEMFFTLLPHYDLFFLYPFAHKLKVSIYI